MILLCKKTYYLKFYFADPEKTFIKGHYYNADFYESDPYESDLIKVYSKTGRIIYFSMFKTKGPKLYYKDYFYTEKEVRDLKLKKIQSNIFQKIIQKIKKIWR